MTMSDRNCWGPPEQQMLGTKTLWKSLGSTDLTGGKEVHRKQQGPGPRDWASEQGPEPGMMTPIQMQLKIPENAKTKQNKKNRWPFPKNVVTGYNLFIRTK